MQPRCMRRGDSVGRYLVLEPVGQGGLGTVYRAYDPDLDRVVALKEVHGLAGDGAGRRTVLREAQAMARLTHPNVVAVYDVIAETGGVFIAMELVEGQDLARWLAETPSLDHILRVFIDCARGLAAAHRANLCHGDCKPSNLLINHEGVGKVADFGLARPAERSVGDDVNARDRMAVLDAIEHDEAPSGAHNRIAGTAAYLAPEVRAGEPADPRSDQYSFCAALYEAVVGRPPAVASEPVDVPRRVPRSLRRLLRRALAKEPTHRFPSMDALADAIQAVRTRRRRLALRVFAGLTVVGAGAYLVVPRDAGPCTGFAARWVGIWDSARRVSVAEALESAGVPNAQRAAARVADVLDDYTHRWTVAHEHACAASLVRKEQSPELYQARSLCYEHRWEQVRALVEILDDADPSLALPLADPGRALEPLGPCGAQAGLLLQVAPLRDASKRQRAREIRGQLADAAARHWAGQAAASSRIAVSAVADAQALGYAPLEAEARLRAGIARTATGAYEQALADLSSAHFIAEAHRVDRIAAASAIGIVALLSVHLEQPSRAEEWSRQATAAVERLGSPDEEAIDLHNALGTMEQTRGELGAALEHYEQALELAERTALPRRTDVGIILQNLATTLEELGRTDEAEARYTQALTYFERELGAEHPSVALVLHNMAVFSHGQQRYEEALALARRAVELKESALPAPHLSVARTLLVMGPILLALDQPEQAQAVLTRAKQIVEEAVGPEHPEMAIALVNLGDVARHRGDLEVARRHFADAVRIFGEIYPDDHPLARQARAHLDALPGEEQQR